MDGNPERCLLENVIPLDLCQELVFLHKSLGVVGYRPGVRSTTIHDVLASAPPMVLPVARARSLVLDAVESALGYECQLFVEFTGLISWSKGSSIGWHHDSNREYLEQRAFAAVLYLNNAGKEFGGGDFRFQDGNPTHVTPKAGRVVAYSAGESNIHCVEEVEWGERFTLTMWFTREAKFCEDPTLIATCFNVRPGLDPLVGNSNANASEKQCLQGAGLAIAGYNHAGLPNEMYIDKCGSDIRAYRLDAFGLSLCESEANDGSVFFKKMDKNDLGDGSGSQSLVSFDSKCHALLVLHFGEWQNLTLHEGTSWRECIKASGEEFDAYLQQSIQLFEKCCKLWVQGGMVSGIDVG
ncbi:hypothetical protein BSKO_07913 [Bryopsis sp. KO-2023]|nr:hypothetical protein BSKO_07913 [Bryopsis sp. KO-2023]